MAKRVNKNLVGALTILAVLATTAGGVVMVVLLPEKDPAFYTEQAEKAIEQAEYAKAAGLYRKAYNVSKDVDYLVRAGTMMYEYGEPGVAIQLFDQATTADRELGEAYLEKLRVMLELARLSAAAQSQNAIRIWQDILETCKALEELDPQNADLLQARGLALINLQGESSENQEKGIEDLERAVKLAPEDPEKAMDLATQLELLTKDYQRAEDVFKNLVNAVPESGKAHRYFGEFLARMTRRGGTEAQVEGYYKRAYAELEKAIQLAPDEVDNYIAMGRVRYSTGKEEDKKKAEEYFARATDSDKDGYRSYLHLGILYLERGEPDKALEVFRERLKVPPVRRGYMSGMRRNNHFLVLRHALLACLQLARSAEDQELRSTCLQEADEFLKSSIAEVGENALTCQMQGEIHIAHDRIREAIREFEEADRLSRGVSIDLKRKLAMLYLRDSSPGSARNALLDVLKAETASRGAASAETLLSLASLENQLQNPRQAVVYTNEVLKAHPNNVRAIQIQMDAYGQMGDTQRVAALNERLEAGGGLGAIMRKARIAVMQEDYEEAEAAFKKALEEEPGNVGIVQPYVGMLVKLDRKSDAAAVVAEAKKHAPEDRRLAAMAILVRPDLDGADRERLLLEQISEEEDPVVRETQLANFYVSKGKDSFGQAIAHYVSAEKALVSPDALEKMGEGPAREVLHRVMERHFGLLLLSEQWDAADELVERCVRQNVDGVNGLFYRGRLAMAKEDLDQAEDYLRAGLELFPTSSEGLQWIGAVQLKKNNLEDARSTFERALSINPNNGYAHLGLAQLHTALGNLKLKEKHLEACKRLVPNDPWVRSQLDLREESEDPTRGIARREKLRQENPEDLRNLLRLAELYRMTGELDKGAAAVEDAVKVDPGNEAVISAAARFYRTADGDADGKGEALLKKYVQDTEGGVAKAKAQLLLAQHYSILGRNDEAKTAFAVAAEIDQNADVCLSIGKWNQIMGRWNEAAEWYGKCLDAMDKPTVFVSRLLVDSILNSTLRENAAREIERYRTNFPDDPIIHVYEGRLAMAEGRLDEAVKKFDLFLEREQSNALGYYLRGHLRYLRNQYDLAIDDLRRAKNLEPRAFAYRHRIELARALGDVGRTDEEIAELNSILEEDPRATQVARFLSGVYQNSKRWVELEAFLLRYENLDPKNPLWPMLRARTLEELKRPQDAMDAYSKAVSVSGFDPGVVNQVAPRLVRYKLYDEVIEIIEKHVPPEKRDPSLVRWLGRAHYLKDEKKKALALYDQALEAAAVSHQLYTVIASDLARTVGVDELTEMMRARIQKDKQDRVAIRLLVELLVARDEVSSEARSILETLLDSTTEDEQRVPLLIRLGIVAYAEKKFDESVQHYKKALELSPDDAFSLNNIAYILAEEMGKPEQGLPYALRAAEILPTANVFDTVGWTYVLLKDYDNGIAWLIRAKDADLNLIASYYHLAKAYQGKGLKDEAIKEVRSAERLAIEQEDKDYLDRINELKRELGL